MSRIITACLVFAGSIALNGATKKLDSKQWLTLHLMAIVICLTIIPTFATPILVMFMLVAITRLFQRPEYSY